MSENEAEVPGKFFESLDDFLSSIGNLMICKNCCELLTKPITTSQGCDLCLKCSTKSTSLAQSHNPTSSTVGQLVNKDENENLILEKAVDLVKDYLLTFSPNALSRFPCLSKTLENGVRNPELSISKNSSEKSKTFSIAPKPFESFFWTESERNKRLRSGATVVSKFKGNNKSDVITCDDGNEDCEDPYKFIPSQTSSSNKAKRKSSKNNEKTNSTFGTAHKYSELDLKECSSLIGNIGKKILDSGLLFEVDEEGIASEMKTLEDVTVGSSRKRKKLSVNGSTGKGRKMTPLWENDSSPNDFTVNVGKEGKTLRVYGKKQEMTTKVAFRNRYQANFYKNDKAEHESAFDLLIGNDKKSLNTDEGRAAQGARVPAKAATSPGFSKLSDLQKEFQSAGVRSRRSLKYYGNELGSKTPGKEEFVKVSPKENQTRSMSQASDLFRELSSQDENPKEKSGDKLEDVSVLQTESSKVLREIDAENSSNVIYSETEKMAHGEEAVMIQNEKSETRLSFGCKKLRNPVITRRISLGRIKNKKNSSILYLELGRMFRKGSVPNVLKLVLPKSTLQKKLRLKSKLKGASTRIQTNKTVAVPATPRLYDVEIQTTQSFLKPGKSNSIDVNSQTSEVIEKEVEKNTQDKNVQLPVEKKKCVNQEADMNITDEQFSTLLNDVEFREMMEVQSSQVKNDVPRSKEEEEGKLPSEKGTESKKKSSPRIRKAGVQLRKKNNVGTLSQIVEESDSDEYIEETPPRPVRTGIETLMASQCVGNDNMNSEDTDVLIVEQGPDIREIEMGIASQVAKPWNGTPKISDKSPVTGKSSISTLQNPEQSGKESKLQPGFAKSLSPRFDLVCSKVSNPENIEKFTKKFNITLSAEAHESMTHLVVGLHECKGEWAPLCTPKLLYSVANKKWIVTESWIEASLKTGYIVAEEHFESVDPFGGDGCKTARTSTELLLKNCEFCLIGQYKDISKKYMKDILETMGGSVVAEPKRFSYSPEKLRMIIFDGEIVNEDPRLKALANQYKTIVLALEYIMTSIQNFSLCKFYPYLLHTLSEKDYLSWGYPLHMFESDDSDFDSCE